MAAPGRYRYEELSPDQVTGVSEYMRSLGLDPQLAMNADTFNRLPEQQRQMLFEQLPNMSSPQLGATRPDVTVTSIGGRPVVQPQEQAATPDEQKELEAISSVGGARTIGDRMSEGIFGTAPRGIGGEKMTPEELEELNQLSTPDGTPEADNVAIAIGGLSSGVLQGGMGAAGFLYGPQALRTIGLVAPSAFTGPWGMALSGATRLVALGAGLTAGQTVSDALIKAPTNDELLARFEGWKTAGMTVGTLPLAFYIPTTVGLRLGPVLTELAETAGRFGPTLRKAETALRTTVGPAIANIGKFAREKPLTSIFAETAAGLRAGVGTYVAETEFEGDPVARFLLETGFGMASPSIIAPDWPSQAGNQLRRLWSLRSRAGREAASEAAMTASMDKATQRLIQILEENGEDIPALIRALDEELPGRPAVSYPGGKETPTGPTAAQKTGSVALAQLEAALGSLDPNFGSKLSEQGRQALYAYSRVIDGLSASGSPEAMRVAADMRMAAFRSALDDRYQRAMEEASVKISKINKDSPEARAEIGRIVQEAVETSLQDARRAERFYWDLAEREANRPSSVRQIRTTQPSRALVQNAYENEAKNIQQGLRKALDIDVNDARQVSRVTGIKAVSISQFLRQNGGITDIGGEFAARDITNKRFPGLIKPPRETESGILLPKDPRSGEDAIREKLFDAGYFPGKASYNDITIDDIADALSQEAAGQRFWQGAVREKLAPVFMEREIVDSWAAEGIEAGMTVEQIGRRLAQLDDVARAEGRTPLINLEALTQRRPRTITTPRLTTPDNTIRSYLERVSNIGEALLDSPSMIPPDVRRIMEKLGIGEDAIRRYNAGKETLQFAKTGRVPPSYLPDPKTLPNIRPKDLINYRSNLLTLAKTASARGDASDASFYGYLADAMLEDLSKLDNPAYDKAREFSRALNDTYTRAFANEITATTRTGAQKIPAEVLVRRAFSTGTDLTSLRMKEIENAVGFMKDRLAREAAEAGPRLPGDPRLAEETKLLRELGEVSDKNVVSVQDAHNRVLRLLASKAVFQDPATGGLRVNTRQLNTFVNEYRPLLDQLGITEDLTNAARAENLLAMVLNRNSAINRTVAQQSAAARVLNYESLTDAVSSAMMSKYPGKNLASLARLAKKAGPDAMEGLKASIYDYVFTKASGGTEVINPETFKKAFFSPINGKKDLPDLASILSREGIMTPQELNNIRLFADRMIQIEDAMANRVALENVLQGADIASELVMRVVGSRIGTAASGGGPASLIAASAGSKAIRQLFDNMPMMAVRKTMQRAAQDPEFMSMLLKRNLSEREKVRLLKTMHAYMLSAGLNYAAYEEPPEEALEETSTGSAAAELRTLDDVFNRLRGRPAPPAPSTRGMPGLTPPSGGGAPPGGGGTPPTSQSRMMLQQLFPNDPITGAAALQAGMPPMPG